VRYAGSKAPKNKQIIRNLTRSFSGLFDSRNNKARLAKPNLLGYYCCMPTIINEDGFLVMIMPNYHRPPHVHVFKASGHARITIGNNEKPGNHQSAENRSGASGKII